MKILRLIASVDRAGGGPIEGIFQSTEALLSDGHEVQIISLDAPESAAIRTAPVKVLGLGPGYGKFRFSPKVIPWLKTNLNEFDAVIVHGLWQFHGLAAWLVMRRMAMPYFVFTHGMLDPWFQRAYPTKKIKKYLYWWMIEYRLLRDARAVLFTAEAERELAAQSFWPYRVRPKVVRYGTAGMPLASDADAKRGQAAFFATIPALGERPYLLFLSRIHPKKGCDNLIRSFALIAPRIPDLQLVISGPDEVGWKGDLEGLARDLGVGERVHWTGMITGDAKWAAIKGAEAFVLPSHSENFGLVLAESLSAGTPVLTTTKVNIWREIVDAGAGLAANDTLEGTTEVLDRYLNLDRTACEQMRFDARRCFKEYFDVETAARNLAQVVEESLRDASAR